MQMVDHVLRSLIWDIDSSSFIWRWLKGSAEGRTVSRPDLYTRMTVLNSTSILSLELSLYPNTDQHTLYKREESVINSFTRSLETCSCPKSRIYDSMRFRDTGCEPSGTCLVMYSKSYDPGSSLVVRDPTHIYYTSGLWQSKSNLTQVCHIIQYNDNNFFNQRYKKSSAMRKLFRIN